jgi:hypothetical protein
MQLERRGNPGDLLVLEISPGLTPLKQADQPKEKTKCSLFNDE